MELLIKEIKKKKELSDIPNKLIEDLVNNYLKKNNLKIPENKKFRKTIIKEIRSEIRRYTGQYQVNSSFKKRLQLLEDKKKKKNI